jgi:BirA family biotin operon repressor/biotin-[acetyl-CoA-carboxylase] ligase
MQSELRKKILYLNHVIPRIFAIFTRTTTSLFNFLFMYNLLPNTVFLGKNIVFLPTCHSTNDVASQMLVSQTVADGTIIITSHQTAGRGQRGNSWEAAPAQNLTFSLILKPVFLPAAEQFTLNMAIALAIHTFLADFLPENDLKIKWSNDLYYKDKKLGGILIENSVKKYNLETSVVGIGLNINQSSFGESKAVSLSSLTGDTFNLEELLRDLSEYLEYYYLKARENGRGNLQELYLKNLYRFQEWHKFQTEAGYVFRGKITDIDASGRLCIENPDGTIQAFGFKEVVFLKEDGTVL